MDGWWWGYSANFIHMQEELQEKKRMGTTAIGDVKPSRLRQMG